MSVTYKTSQCHNNHRLEVGGWWLNQTGIFQPFHGWTPSIRITSDKRWRHYGHNDEIAAVTVYLFVILGDLYLRVVPVPAPLSASGVPRCSQTRNPSWRFQYLSLILATQSLKMESRITEAWDEAKQAAARVRLFINNVSNDHPFYYRLVFTVIMIYMPAASSSPLLSLRSPAWKDVTGPGWQHQPAAAAGDRDGKKQVGSRRFVITEKAPTRAFS